MRTTAICVLILACLACMTLARPGGRGGRGGQGGRHGGYRGSLPTAEERLEHFEGTLTRIPESYHVEARALFAEQEEILDDVTNLNDLTDGERAEYDDVKKDIKDLLDEAHFEQSIAFLSEVDQIIARQLKLEIDNLLGDGDRRDLSDADKVIFDEKHDQLKELQRISAMKYLKNARFEQSIAFLSEADQITARQLQSEIDELLGDGDRRDLSVADKVIFDEKHDQLKELQRQSCFEGKVSELSAEDQATARELSDQIQTLVGDGTPCELSDEDRATFDDLSEQLSTLLGDTRTHGPRCDRRGGRGGRGGRH